MTQSRGLVIAALGVTQIFAWGTRCYLPSVFDRFAMGAPLCGVRVNPGPDIALTSP
jgi:hypothetical protein